MRGCLLLGVAYCCSADETAPGRHRQRPQQTLPAEAGFLWRRPGPTFQADSAGVTNGANVWAAPVAEESARTPGAPYFDVLARNGPKWGPGIEVDVAVRLHDAAGRSVLLRARRQPITRTD